jgi:hypothetical protein
MDLNVSRPLSGPIVMLGAAVAVAGGLASPAAALTITPIFDSSITSAGNAAAVEGAISSAIGTIDSLFTDPGTLDVVFKSQSGSFLGASQSADYSVSYAGYQSLLQADSAANPTNTVLATAIAHLSQGNDANGAYGITGTSALFRVGLGQSWALPCFDSSGTGITACGGTSTNPGIADGVVYLSTSYPFYYSPSSYVAGAYNARVTIEHELDEILGGGGQGSVLNDIQRGATVCCYGPLDLYRYSAPGVPSFTTSSTATAYLSVNGGTTDVVAFNQSSTGDYGDTLPNSQYVQSAFTGTNSTAPYNASSPEVTMLSAIGYDPVATPEPASLALLGPAIAGIGWMRRRGGGSQPR